MSALAWSPSVNGTTALDFSDAMSLLRKSQQSVSSQESHLEGSPDSPQRNPKTSTVSLSDHQSCGILGWWGHEILLGKTYTLVHQCFKIGRLALLNTGLSNQLDHTFLSLFYCSFYIPIIYPTESHSEQLTYPALRNVCCPPHCLRWAFPEGLRHSALLRHTG